MGGLPLTKSEIANRYRLDLMERITPEVKSYLGLAESARYMWEDPPKHLIDRIQGYEQNYGQADAAHVTLDYQVAGDPIVEWRWPT